MLDFVKNSYPTVYQRHADKRPCSCGDIIDLLICGEISYIIKEKQVFPEGFDDLEYNYRRKIMDTLKIINTHGCVKCTMKHLASAIVEMGELRKGYWNTDHEIFCMGNLAEASEQIDEYSNDIAMELRSLRIDIFETQKLVNEDHLKIAKELFWKIKKIAEPDVVIKESKPVKVAKNMQNHYRSAQAQAQLDVKEGVKPSGCGCKKRSTEVAPNGQ
jgi:hypothetical protein